MPANDNDQSGARAPVIDHPAPLGDLASVFRRRNIAVAETSDGQVVLVRPDSALVAAPRSAEEEDQLSQIVNNNRGLVRENGWRESRVGLITVDLSDRGMRQLDGEARWSVEAVNGFLDEASARALRAEYNYVVIGAQTVTGSPLGFPAGWAGEMAFLGHTVTSDGDTLLLSTAHPATEPPTRRAPLALRGHKAPNVLILDTGLRTVEDRPAGSRRSTGTRRPEHPFLSGCAVYPEWASSSEPGVVDDEDEPFDPPEVAATTSTEPTVVLDFEAGHGTFIAGVVRQICPDAEITTAGVLSSFGEGDVSGVLETFERIRGLHGPFDIVVMSFGTNLVDDEPGFFGRSITGLLGDSLGIAAAGNQSTSRPYFPAALPDVVGVGGLAADGKAWFTNFGGWVDACAPAVDVVSSFFLDFAEQIEGKEHRRYQGWARWSGTSFAAPKVAALVAQEMYLHGGTPKQAWKRLISHKHFRYPDLGIVFNV